MREYAYLSPVGVRSRALAPRGSYDDYPTTPTNRLERNPNILLGKYAVFGFA